MLEKIRIDNDTQNYNATILAFRELSSNSCTDKQEMYFPASGFVCFDTFFLTPLEKSAINPSCSNCK